MLLRGQEVHIQGSEKGFKLIVGNQELGEVECTTDELGDLSWIFDRLHEERFTSEFSTEAQKRLQGRPKEE